MSRVFDAYASYYDLLYKDKDYDAEAQYVIEQIRSLVPGASRILELGCGTGAHAERLAAAGFEVHGIDFSDSMVAAATARKASLHSDIAGRLRFSCGDIRVVRGAGQYDVVISLFHVMSYLTTNADLASGLTAARSFLSPGGGFLFDFWYGPAVLAQQPDVRVKRLENEESRILRLAEPVMHSRSNVVDVRFTVWVEEKSSGRITQVKETHPMRYLFLPELEYQAGPSFRLERCHAWMTSREPEVTDWAAIAALRAT